MTTICTQLAPPMTAECVLDAISNQFQGILKKKDNKRDSQIIIMILERKINALQRITQAQFQSKRDLQSRVSPSELQQGAL